MAFVLPTVAATECVYFDARNDTHNIYDKERNVITIPVSGQYFFRGDELYLVAGTELPSFKLSKKTCFPYQPKKVTK